MINSDEDILEKLKQNEEGALKRLYDLYYMPLCLYSVQITDSFESSEDIVQDFIVRFWEKKIYRQISDNLRSYLFYAIRNASLAFVREKRSVFLEEVEQEAYSMAEEEYDESELLRKKEMLYRELQELPEKGLRIFEAIVFERKKYKEVAEELGISVNSVKTHFSRTLKRLRASIPIIIWGLL